MSRLRLLITFLLLRCCVLGGLLLLALSLVLPTTLISHCISPLLQVRTSWNRPVGGTGFGYLAIVISGTPTPHQAWLLASGHETREFLEPILDG